MDPFKLFAIVVALGLVIFVHELGHFLVARWAGVLVERFSIGFGPVLFSFKRGDTEYAISAIPLGGYVKMLGQTDTPEVEQPLDDVRSYQNKSVGARMAIISAGVIMNLIFGFVCFSVAFRLGVPYMPAIVGAAIPNDPGWTAGLRAGDHLVKINGHYPTDYEMLTNEVALTNPASETVELDVVRGDQKFTLNIKPKQEQMKPRIGVSMSNGLTLTSKDFTLPRSPAQRAANPAFQAQDTILAINGEKVKDYHDYALKMFAHQGEPVTVEVERNAPDDKPGEKLNIKLEPAYVRSLGLEMTIGEIVGVQQNSPALKGVDANGQPAKIQPRDLIKAVDGVTDIDPLRLPDVITAKAGKPVELTLLRLDKEQKEIKVTVVPEPIPTWIDFPDYPGMNEDCPASIPSIGVAYKVLPTVRKVGEGSPAATAETPIKPGDVVIRADFFHDFPRAANPIGFDVKDDEWPSVYWWTQFSHVLKVKLKVKRDGVAQPFDVTLEPRPDSTWPMRLRGLTFQEARAERKEDSTAGALRAGFEHSRASVIRLYLILRGLTITRTISWKNLAGPLTIGREAYYRAQNLPWLIVFVGLLSINLAIINFLPIPILDGGHMVFLTYELIMRRRPSDNAVHAANIAGLVLILSLMVCVLSLDIWRMM